MEYATRISLGEQPMHTTPSAAPATQNPSRLPWHVGPTGTGVYDAQDDLVVAADGSGAQARANAEFIVALANATIPVLGEVA
jgi:hypothetical protein